MTPRERAFMQAAAPWTELERLLKEEVTMLRGMLDKAFAEYVGESEEPVSLHDSFERLRDLDSGATPPIGGDQ